MRHDQRLDLRTETKQTRAVVQTRRLTLEIAGRQLEEILEADTPEGAGADPPELDQLGDSEAALSGEVEPVADYEAPRRGAGRLRDLPYRARPPVRFWIDADYHVHRMMAGREDEVDWREYIARAIASYLRSTGVRLEYPGDWCDVPAIRRDDVLRRRLPVGWGAPTRRRNRRRGNGKPGGGMTRAGPVSSAPTNCSTGSTPWPVAILAATGADFDGDQMAVAALETEAALAEAERLVPAAHGLRSDPFRDDRPAFPLCKELADPPAETELAADQKCDPESWRTQHAALVARRVEAVGDGWDAARPFLAYEDHLSLWDGLAEEEWFEMAEREMESVYRSVRLKGRLGGVFRRQFYRLPWHGEALFTDAVQAPHAVAERLAQSALSVKTGTGGATFRADRFFQDPATD